MKRTVFVIAFIFFWMNNFSQGTFPWIKSFGSSGDDVGYAILHADNSIYVGGWFTNTVVFGEDTLISAGGTDMFILRMSLDGEILWARRCGGIDDDTFVGISTDNNGNIYFSGYCGIYSDFGSTFLPGYGDKDAVIVRIDSNGVFRWALNGGGYNFDCGLRISVSQAGDVISFAGYYMSDANFGPFILYSYGGRDAFVAQVDSSGHYNWVFSSGTSSDEAGYGVAVDNTGNTYVLGYFFSDVWQIGNYTLINNGYASDCYLLKLSKNGSIEWAKSFGGYDDDLPRPLMVAGNSLYMAGYHYGSGDFLGVPLQGKGSRDIFVLKADTSGNGIWAFGGVSTADDECIGLALSQNNEVMVSGAFEGQMLFGGNTFNSYGYYDALVVKLRSDDGLPKGIATGGSEYDDMFYGIECVDDGIYLTGYINDQATFADSTLFSKGAADIIITKLSDKTFQVPHSQKYKNVEIKVSPNPCSSTSRISWEGIGPQDFNITIVSSSGIIVATYYTGKNNTFLFDRTGIASGIYLVKVYSKANSQVGAAKLIIN